MTFERYEGDFEEGSPHGAGAFLGLDGAVTAGEFRNGALHGFAIDEPVNSMPRNDAHVQAHLRKRASTSEPSVSEMFVPLASESATPADARSSMGYADRECTGDKVPEVILHEVQRRFEAAANAAAHRLAAQAAAGAAQAAATASLEGSVAVEVAWLVACVDGESRPEPVPVSLQRAEKLPSDDAVIAAVMLELTEKVARDSARPALLESVPPSRSCARRGEASNQAASSLRMYAGR